MAIPFDREKELADAGFYPAVPGAYKHPLVSGDAVWHADHAQREHLSRPPRRKARGLSDPF